MLPWGFLLLSVAVTAMRYVEKENYTLYIADHVLKRVHAVGKLPNNIDFSNLNLKSVDPNTDAQLHHVKILNIADNEISNFAPSMFANLQNLEYLNLAKNRLSSGNFYQGLSNLRLLNISENPLSRFGPGHFFGLSSSTKILTQGNALEMISTLMFENYSMQTNQWQTKWTKKGNTLRLSTNLSSDHEHPNPTSNPHKKDNKTQIYLCVHDGHLQSLNALNTDKTSATKCQNVNRHSGLVLLRKLGISTFQNKWYKLVDHGITAINLAGNTIIQVTKSLLNDLPHEIVQIILRGNLIEELVRDVLENKNPIKKLDLGDNCIHTIEDGALAKLNLVGELVLVGNGLKNTRFLDSLPSDIRKVSLSRNSINEILAGNFSKFTRFSNLNLHANTIMEANADRLRGFWSLRYLDLSFNGLQRIERGFFRDLKNLQVVKLQFNSISTFEVGVFEGLENVVEIDLSSNFLTNISIGVFTGLPDSLRLLDLSLNQLKILWAGTFARVPKYRLNLSDNKISKIQKGSFDLPNLEQLDLQNNRLIESDSEWFEGLAKLEVLSLASNRITTIQKGMIKDLKNLSFLDISGNPITILENGALFGLPKREETCVGVSGVPIQAIMRGLFDDE